MYRSEDSVIVACEISRKIQEAIQLAWLSQNKVVRSNDKEIALECMEKQVKQFVERAISNFKDDARDAEQLEPLRK
jgi:hypothetical protein